ncbi:MAG: hypothetical protein HYY17_07770 [Planctomycetes bacterium]|nr:hypothetical protein [Planctomycetota bacterium]
MVAENGEKWRDSEDALTARQRKAIPILVSSTTREAGCDAAKIARSTLSKWLNDPSFVKALENAEARAYCASLARVQRLAGSAAEALEGLLRSEVESIRLRAAVEILTHGLKARDAIEIDERLAALEARLVER